MPERNIENLPLLATFKAIFDHGSLGEAGEALGLTQSAVSKKLAKLRDWFDDDLFIRTASGMEPTDRALSLLPQVEALLRDAGALMKDRPFTPAELSGNVVIATTDEIRARLVPPLLHGLRNEAPGLRLTLIPLEGDYSLRRLENGSVNFVVSVNWHAPDQLRQKRLFGDRFVCLMHRDNALATGRLSLDRYAAASHIMVAPLGMERGYIDQFLLQQRRKRFVCLSVPDFAQVNAQTLGTGNVVSLPHRVALALAEEGDLVIRQLPFAVPMIDYYLFWHQRFAREPKTLWLKEKIAGILT